MDLHPFVLAGRGSHIAGSAQALPAFLLVLWDPACQRAFVDLRQRGQIRC